MAGEDLTIRGHNEGTIFRRKTGQYVSAVTMRDGRRASRTTHSLVEARAALAELLRLRDAGAPITARIRLGSYLERWVSDDHGWAPKTWTRHREIVRLHLAGGPLGRARLSELSVGDVDRWLGSLDHLHPQTRRHVRSTLRRALADAIRDGVLTRNVAGLSRPPALQRRERPVLDANQARLLIDSTRGTRYGPLWTLLVTTGLRISEALGLAWSDVGPDSITVRRQLARENGEWVRRPPKTDKGRRTIPLTPLAVDALRAQREQQAADLGERPAPIDGLVFTNAKGRPLHGENTVKRLHADLAAAGLPRVNQHDLRHSCATLLYSVGVPLETISDILGHSTTRITADLYRHRVGELTRAAADRMQEALG
jgi:integrase